jgi:hypothetical protein
MNPGCSRRKLARYLETGAGEPEVLAGSEYRGRGGDLRLPEAAESEPDIVEFRAREAAVVVVSSCDKHLTVGQQRRRVFLASGNEASRI